MLNCSGKSLVPINIVAFQQFLNSVIPPGKLESFEIKLDGRAKVKSVFAKLEENVLTIYTGALVGVGLQKFPEVTEPVSLLMLFALYGIKKAGLNEDFEVKSTDQGIAEVKTDANFQMLAGNLHLFMQRFLVINDQAIAAPEPAPTVQEPVNSTETVVSEQAVEAPVKEKKSKASAQDSPYKGIPLENTPKIEVPADLDLRMV